MVNKLQIHIYIYVCMNENYSFNNKNNKYFYIYINRLALPLLSGYILSGHFTPLKKFKDSIYQNILFYGVLGGIGVIFVIYIAIARQMTG